MIPAALLLTVLIFFFLKLTAYIGRFLKNSQNFFIQSLPLYTSCLFPMLLNEGLILGLFLHPSIFSIMHSRSA